MTYDPKKGIEILLEGVEKIGTIYKMLTNFEMSLADAHLRSNTPSKAVGYYKSVLKRQPEEYSILYNIAHTYDRMADLENALSYYEQFIKTFSKQKLAKKDEAAERSEKHISTENFYYEAASKRIQKIKEELFLKKGKR